MSVIILLARSTLVALPLAVGATGQATSPGIRTKTVAEVETRTNQSGRVITHLMPADRVVPGDEVIYTVEVRNVGSVPVRAPTVVNAIPAHMIYVAESATGPGAEVSFSIDGGHSFDRADNLKVAGADGNLRAAKPTDYTHIRWQLKNTLKSHSTAFARFRAVVK